MILRIFATDGHTPERIFRWSVEETAEHLCAQQVLWVTRLDGPWQKLVDWFLKHKSCRAVVLDHADRWEWNLEHEITWRIAQGLYYHQDEEIESVCWLHDDMAPPLGHGFQGYLREWLASGSTALEAPCYQLWDGFDSVRADKVGIDFAADLHCWLAKPFGLRWIREAAELAEPNDAPDRFRPLGAVPSICPYPFRHAKGLDRDFREMCGFTRRGFPPDRWKNADGVRCVPYDPDLTWEEFRSGDAVQRRVQGPSQPSARRGRPQGTQTFPEAAEDSGREESRSAAP